ncbi:MAG: hypothetical protein ACRDKG_05130, partial [Actinomycetota bacterium]
RDTVVEAPEAAGGTLDTLDFSSFEASTTAGDGIAMDVTMAADGFAVRLGVGGADPGTLFTAPVEGIERVELARGSTSVTVAVDYVWSADVQLVRGTGSLGTEAVDLDLSAVASDLIFEIGADGRVTVYQAQTTAYGVLEKIEDGHTLVVDRVHDLTGGTGRNLFRMLAGARLHGDLQGGAAGSSNFLDYAAFGAAVRVNLTAEEVVYSDAFGAGNIVALDGIDDAWLPVQEKWSFSVSGLSGAVYFSGAEQGALFRDETGLAPAVAEATRHQDAQKLRDALAGHLGRNDFTVTKSQDAGAGETTWTVVFAEPEAVELGAATQNAILGSAARAWVTIARDNAGVAGKADGIAKQLGALDKIFESVSVTGGSGTEASPWTIRYTLVDDSGDALKSQDAGVELGERTAVAGQARTYTQFLHLTVETPAKFHLGAGDLDVALEPQDDTDNGRAAADRTYELFTNATDGTFNLRIAFADLAGNPVVADAALIPLDATPDALRAALQSAIDAVVLSLDGRKIRPEVDLDVTPKVLVHGAGTAAFPWRVTFANMGEVALSAAGSALDALPPAIAARSASGIAGAVNGIGDVTGTTQHDRLYGIERALALVHQFAGIGEPDAPSIAGQNALVFDTALDLLTGQPVLYEVNAGHDAINGLVSGKVYFVGVTAGADTTSVKFYLSEGDARDDRNVLKLSDPGDTDAANAVHTLKDVPVVRGGNGESVIVSTVGNAAGVVFGSGGADVLSGSNGADYIDGGGGGDVLYADGSHGDPAEDEAGEDGVFGGAGDDHIVGYNGAD